MRGNPGKRAIDVDEPEHDASPPEPPEWLTDTQREQFLVLRGRLEEEGRASASHAEVLMAAAMRLAEVVEANRTIASEGVTYTTTTAAGDTMIRNHPAVGQRSEALRQLQSLLAEMGLTPTASTKVKVTKPKAASPLAELLGKR